MAKKTTAKDATPKAPSRKQASGLAPATLLVHGGILRSQFGENAEAIFMTQSYVYDSAEQAERRFKGEDPGFIYSRYANPTVSMFEERMRLLEGAGAARATASGMAAVATVFLSSLKAGDHVVSAKALFSSCRYIIEELLPRYGIQSTLVDGTDLNQWADAVRKGSTKAFFLESPTNPTLEIIDIAEVAKIAHKRGARLIVDNVFATPLYQKPLTLGADVVVYSATKHVDGQGRSLGGIILADEKFILDNVHQFLRQTGPSLSPFNAWIMLKGLETMPVRVERQSATAATIADHLARHPRVTRVLYPTRADHPQAAVARKQMTGGSTLVTFEIEGGRAAGFKVCNAVRVIRISNNLGDAKSLICHPSTTTHQRLSETARVEFGITQGMLRLSVGLEDPGDLMADLDQALDTLG